MRSSGDREDEVHPTGGSVGVISRLRSVRLGFPRPPLSVSDHRGGNGGENPPSEAVKARADRKVEAAASSEGHLPRLHVTLPFILLGLFLVARLTDTGESVTGGGPLLMTIAIFAVQAVLVVLRVRRLPLPGRLAILAVLAVLTYLPYVLFADDWRAPMAWQLACSVLLVLPGRIAWPLFAVIVMGEGPIHWLVFPQDWLPQYGSPRVPFLFWFIAVTINDALLLFVAVRLRDTAVELHRARDELARLATAQERAGAARNLDTVLGGGLSAVMTHAERARHLALEGQAGARMAMDHATSAARRLLGEVRSLVRDHDPGRPVAAVDPHARESTRLPLVALLTWLFLISVQCLIGLNTYSGVRGWGLLGYGLLQLALVSLQLRHSLPPWAGARPSGLWWTMPLQVVLAVVPCALFPVWRPYGFMMLGMMAASVALLVPGRRGLLISLGLLSGLSLAAVPVPIAGWANDSPVVFLANFSMVLTLGALCVYGPGRLIGLIRQLKAVREKTARMAVAHERERIAQDTHDLLGFGLSTITLKCELAQRLIGTDPERALREITEVLRLCAGVAQDTRSVAGAPQGLTLAREAAAAEAALRVGGATVRVELPAAALPVRVETVLATVLREAVTNVLRHSNPDCCGIQVEVADGVARLRVTNDGTFILNGLGSRALAEHGAEAPLVSPGHGLANLTRRTETAGGTLVAGPDGHGRFILQTEIPLHSGGLDRAEDVHVQP